MRVKAKTWGVIGKKRLLNGDNTPHSIDTKNTQYSQLQTVLITASGPQASNALVHRERYTQGSRQNRCVSSQEALALRAKALGNRGGPVPFGRRPIYCCCTWFRPCAHCVRPFVPLRRLFIPRRVVSPFVSPWHHGMPVSGPSWAGVSKDCQLRTAYGGESNCIIKT